MAIKLHDKPCLMGHATRQTVAGPPIQLPCHGPLTRHVKFRVAHAPGTAGKFFTIKYDGEIKRKPLVSYYPGMHLRTCVIVI